MSRVATPEGQALAAPISATPPTPARLLWLRARVTATAAAGPEPAALLDTLWTGYQLPRKHDRPLTDTEVTVAAGAVAIVGMVYALPFHGDDGDPGPTPELLADGTPVSEQVLRGRALLAVFDEPEQRAIAAAADCTATVTDAALERLTAVVAQLHAPNGALLLIYGPAGPEVVVAPEAVLRMAEAHRTKTAALTAAKAHARALGADVPKTLDQAAKNGLVAALTSNPTPTEETPS